MTFRFDWTSGRLELIRMKDMRKRCGFMRAVRWDTNACSSIAMAASLMARISEAGAPVSGDRTAGADAGKAKSATGTNPRSEVRGQIVGGKPSEWVGRFSKCVRSGPPRFFG